jgi:hypothetical protein
MARKEYNGGTTATTLSGALSSGSTSFSVADGSTFPSGGSNPFVVVIDRGMASEEKLLIDSRSSNTFTVNASGRGYDDTSDVSHSSGATVEHCLDAETIDEANAHVNDDTRDDHSQYLNTTRHAAISHTAAMIGAGEVGNSELASNAVTNGKITDGTIEIAKLGATANFRQERVRVVAKGTNCATGDNQEQVWFNASYYGGWVLHAIHARHDTAGSGGSATIINIRNSRTSNDVLSTALTIDSTESASDSAATAVVIDSGERALQAGDYYLVDIDQVDSTPPQGLVITFVLVYP